MSHPLPLVLLGLVLAIPSATAVGLDLGEGALVVDVTPIPANSFYYLLGGAVVTASSDAAGAGAVVTLRCYDFAFPLAYRQVLCIAEADGEGAASGLDALGQAFCATDLLFSYTDCQAVVIQGDDVVGASAGTSDYFGGVGPQACAVVDPFSGDVACAKLVVVRHVGLTCLDLVTSEGTYWDYTSYAHERTPLACVPVGV